MKKLFYISPIKSWRSMPTPGIIFSTLFATLYIILKYKELSFISIKGFISIWAFTRYNIIHPSWLSSEIKDEDQINKYNKLSTGLNSNDFVLLHKTGCLENTNIFQKFVSVEIEKSQNRLQKTTENFKKYSWL